MRIVIISPTLPFPPDNGGKLRAAAVALELAKHHEVALACFADDGAGASPAGVWSGHFRDVKIVPPRPPGPWPRRWLSLSPSEVSEFHSVEMERHVTRLVAQFSPDVLVAGDPGLTHYVAPYTDRVRILDYVCVATLQFERLRAISTGPRQALWALRRMKFAAHLRRIARCYDLCVVNSEEDRAALVAAAPAWPRVEVLPNGLDLSGYPLGLALPQPDTLVFPGALTYPPNLDGARHFIQEILPLIRAEVPAVRFVVTGRIPARNFAPQAPGVEYTGYVPDVRPVIAGSWACAVPLRTGAGGTRFKVLESLALGTPVVSTTIGAEGVAATHGEDILLADEPTAFAHETVKVLRSPELRSRLAVAGRRLIERQYDWQVLGARFATLLDELRATRRQVKPPA
jgi:glycosyltransferase involved in cell wall biosynthesis